VQYPFGFGLSYTSFNYEAQNKLNSKYKLADSLTVVVKVKNIGQFDGDEVVQAYIEYPKIDRMPIKELKCFKRVSVDKGSAHIITLKVPVKDLQKWDLQKQGWRLYNGSYKLILGGNSKDEKVVIPFEVSGS
jgi:beta-glucosidase